jgi:hypothetical protein
MSTPEIIIFRAQILPLMLDIDSINEENVAEKCARKQQSHKNRNFRGEIKNDWFPDRRECQVASRIYEMVRLMPEPLSVL